MTPLHCAVIRFSVCDGCLTNPVILWLVGECPPLGGVYGR